MRLADIKKHISFVDFKGLSSSLKQESFLTKLSFQIYSTHTTNNGKKSTIVSLTDYDYISDYVNPKVQFEDTIVFVSIRKNTCRTQLDFTSRDVCLALDMQYHRQSLEQRHEMVK